MASPSPITRIDLDRAVAQGTPQLSAGARCLLAFYASHLSLENPTKTSVFPGTERATSCLGISPATLRRHKGELEEAGFLIRCYDRRNRPLEGGAIDLKPLLIRVPELLGTLSKELDAQRQRWTLSRAPEEASAMNAQVLTCEPLNSPKNSSENSSFETHEKRGGGPLATNGSLGQTHDENQNLIAQVLCNSPKLRDALSDGFEASSPNPTATLRAVLPTLFPNETAGSIGHTGLWAEQRLGAAMFAAVAISVEDPEVRRPAAYFGRLVTRAEGYDPKENLKRLAELNPAPVELKLHGDPVSDRALELIAAKIGDAAAASWFGPGQVRFRMEGRILFIEPTTKFAAGRIRERYGDLLSTIARQMDAEALAIVGTGETKRTLKL